MISRASEDASKHWNLSIHTHIPTPNSYAICCLVRPRAREHVLTRLVTNFVSPSVCRLRPHTTQDLVGIHRALSHTGGGWIRFSLLTTPTFNRGRATQIRYNEDNCIVDVCTRRTCVLHTKHSWPIYRYHFRDIILQTVKTSNHSGLVNFHIMLEQFREHRDGTNPINGQPFGNVR